MHQNNTYINNTIFFFCCFSIFVLFFEFMSQHQPFYVYFHFVFKCSGPKLWLNDAHSVWVYVCMCVYVNVCVCAKEQGNKRLVDERWEFGGKASREKKLCHNYVQHILHHINCYRPRFLHINRSGLLFCNTINPLSSYRTHSFAFCYYTPLASNVFCLFFYFTHNIS